MVGTPADFLIGSKTDSNGVVLDFWMVNEIRSDRHDDGHSSLIIGA